ncbi:Fc.00g054820.m01.CDS01 [Cosmosporella sp. VM-42]
MSKDLDVLIIGAGMSGLGMAIQLVRQYGTRNFEIIEKTGDIGGTWWLNSYPGCGCDVPSHFYSYSFALNPNWSQKFALQPEIHAYFKTVAAQYRIEDHVRFHTVVESAHWDETSGTWLVKVQDTKNSQVIERRYKVLVSAVGALSIPRKCDIPGAGNFKGRLFHSAEWDHTFDWSGKEVIVIGNGCSATQIVPVIAEGDGAVTKVTQFSRQAHWLADRPNPQYSPLFKWIMRWIPFAMRSYRAMLYWEKESGFRGFDITTGAEIREGWSSEAANYIRKNGPEKYREFLVPKTEIGCKRRVNDTDYLRCLHYDNVELIHNDSVLEIEESGVKTASGRLISADAIVLANGFEAQKFLFPMEIHGKNEETIEQHWDRVSEGASSAYLGTCISGFPNFFILMGPNTLSGHLSVIYTTECQINFTLRILQPLMRYLRRSRSALPTPRTAPDVVEVKSSAEERDISTVQKKASRLVWATGCTSWFIEPRTKRNSIMYPDWQYKFWLKSVFPTWSDFTYRHSGEAIKDNKSWGLSKATVTSAFLGVTVVAGALIFGRTEAITCVKGALDYIEVS